MVGETIRRVIVTETETVIETEIVTAITTSETRTEMAATDETTIETAATGALTMTATGVIVTDMIATSMIVTAARNTRTTIGNTNAEITTAIVVNKSWWRKGRNMQEHVPPLLFIGSVVERKHSLLPLNSTQPNFAKLNRDQGDKPATGGFLLGKSKTSRAKT